MSAPQGATRVLRFGIVAVLILLGAGLAGCTDKGVAPVTTEEPEDAPVCLRMVCLVKEEQRTTLAKGLVAGTNFLVRANASFDFASLAASQDLVVWVEPEANASQGARLVALDRKENLLRDVAGGNGSVVANPIVREKRVLYSMAPVGSTTWTVHLWDLTTGNSTQVSIPLRGAQFAQAWVEPQVLVARNATATDPQWRLDRITGQFAPVVPGPMALQLVDDGYHLVGRHLAPSGLLSAYRRANATDAFNSTVYILQDQAQLETNRIAPERRVTSHAVGPSGLFMGNETKFMLQNLTRPRSAPVGPKEPHLWVSNVSNGIGHKSPWAIYRVYDNKTDEAWLELQSLTTGKRTPAGNETDFSFGPRALTKDGFFMAVKGPRIDKGRNWVLTFAPYPA